MIRIYSNMIHKDTFLAEGVKRKYRYLSPLIDWFHIVYCLVQEYLTHLEMSLLLVKGCEFNLSPYGRRLWPLIRDGSLSCYTCYDTEPPKDRPAINAIDTCRYHFLSYTYWYTLDFCGRISVGRVPVDDH